MLNISAIAAFQDNYIWLLTNNNQAVVVDPGQAAPVQKVLAERNLTLAAILITHHHHDHTGGVKTLAAQWPEAAVYAPAKEPLPINTAIAVDEGDRVSLPALDLDFDVMATPGHTLGHIAYYEPNGTKGEPLLFCGDTLFSGGCGRLFEGSPQQMYDALSRFSQLPENTRVYGTHEYTQANLAFCYAVEPNNQALQQYMQQVAKWRQQGIPSLPSSIGRERAINVFLRADIPEVKAAMQNRAGAELTESVEVFAALRRWKDDF